MKILYKTALDRRSFIKVLGGATGTALVSSMTPVPLVAQYGGNIRETVPSITDSLVHELVFKGVEAARTAGAQYAEVRLTNDLIRDVGVRSVSDFQSVNASVRAFFNGAWGFASGPLWSGEAIVALAQHASLQAKENAAVMKGAGIDLEALPKVDVVSKEHWEMPVKIDPFSVHPFVMQDFFQGIIEKTKDEFGRHGGQKVIANIKAKFTVQERALGTSDGWYGTQRLYITSGTAGVSLEINRTGGTRMLNLMSPAGLGWEHITEKPIREALLGALHDIKFDMGLHSVPIVSGKYAVMLNASTVAQLVSQTIGMTSEIDRALGYEANTSGITYLNNPAMMLDRFAVGSSMLTVTANRSEPGGLATVKWDDEGITPTPFTIVKDGVLHDYHLSREGVAWLQKEKISGRTKPQGVVSGIRASDKPYVRTANLEIKPSTTPADEKEVVYQLQDGIAFEDSNLNMDSSMLNGVLGGGRVYQIKGGKKVSKVTAAALAIHTPELWKSLHILGGADSKVRIGLSTKKGTPEQDAFHSVTSIPAAFRDQTVTDIFLR